MCACSFRWRGWSPWSDGASGPPGGVPPPASAAPAPRQRPRLPGTAPALRPWCHPRRQQAAQFPADPPAPAAPPSTRKAQGHDVGLRGLGARAISATGVWGRARHWQPSSASNASAISRPRPCASCTKVVSSTWARRHPLAVAPRNGLAQHTGQTLGIQVLLEHLEAPLHPRLAHRRGQGPPGAPQSLQPHAQQRLAQLAAQPCTSCRPTSAR